MNVFSKWLLKTAAIEKKECSVLSTKRKRGNVLSRFVDNVSSGIQKFNSYLPIYGLRNTLIILLKNIFVIETVYRLEKDLDELEQKVESTIPIDVICYKKGFDINNWIYMQEIIEIRGSYGINQFSNRLDNEYLFFCAFSENSLAGFLWCELPPATEAGYKLKKDEAYGIDGWVFNKYRGKRIHSILHQAVFHQLRENHPEIRRYVVHVATWNKSSYRGDQRAGLKITQRELLVKVINFHKKFPLNRSNLPPQPL